MSHILNTTWTILRSFVDDKKLNLQFTYNPDGYEIFSFDGDIGYTTVIYNNAVPDPSVYSQVQNDADKADFLANYFATANRAIFPTIVRDGYATTEPISMFVGAGKDNGGIARAINTSTDGYVTVQGSASGVPIPISGTVTANNASVGLDNAAAPGSSTQIGGTDGTNLQSVHVYDTDTGGGTQYTLGVNLRKSSSGGSVEAGTATDPIRVDPTGTTAQPVTDNGGSLTVDGTVAVSSVAGNVTVVQPTASALNAQVQGTAADGAAPVGNPVLMAGQDGTNVQSLKTDTTGRPEVVGAGTSGSAVAGAPVRIGGSDGTNTRDILTDTTGRQVVVGGAADGSPPAGAPVLMAGQDGTNVQSLATDGYGALVVTGKNAVGTPPTQNPVVVGGWDGTNVVRLRLNADGSIATSEKELATFTALATSTALANNKSVFSIVNASGSTVIAKISSIYITSVQTASITGVAGFFELHRIVNHSAGTAITAIETLDSGDALNGSVTVRTGSTVTSESANLLWRAQFTSDEWSPSTQLDVSAENHLLSTMFPVWNRKDRDNKPIVLRANEGLTVKFATNSSVGAFDIMVVFTQE